MDRLFASHFTPVIDWIDRRGQEQHGVNWPTLPTDADIEARCREWFEQTNAAPTLRNAAYERWRDHPSPNYARMVADNGWRLSGVEPLGPSPRQCVERQLWTDYERARAELARPIAYEILAERDAGRIGLIEIWDDRSEHPFSARSLRAVDDIVRGRTDRGALYVAPQPVPSSDTQSSGRKLGRKPKEFYQEVTDELLVKYLDDGDFDSQAEAIKWVQDRFLDYGVKPPEKSTCQDYIRKTKARAKQQKEQMAKRVEKAGK